MWIKFKTVPNLMMAEMWKEFFEGEGVPTRILAEGGEGLGGIESIPYGVFIPQEKDHVIREILRKA